MATSAHRELLPQELRRRRRKLFLWKIFAYVLGALLVVGGVALLFGMDTLRITEIHVGGQKHVSPRAVRESAVKALTGSYAFVFPKNNTLLISKKEITAAIIEGVPQVETVLVERTGLTAITVTITERSGEAEWCQGSDRTVCYLADASGVLFTETPKNKRGAASTTLPQYSFPLKKPNASPLGQTILSPKLFMLLTDFTTAMHTKDWHVAKVGPNETGDIELTFSDGTRALLPADDNLESALRNLTLVLSTETFLTGKPVEYVDVRFGNKVFYKEE